MDLEIDAFLSAELPEWKDDACMKLKCCAYYNKSDERWNNIFFFWQNAITKVSQHLRKFTITSDEVKYKWFRRHGVVPLCLDRVLGQMVEQKLLQRVHTSSGLEVSVNYWSKFCQLWNLFSFSSGTHQNYINILVEGKFVVTENLERKSGEIIALVKSKLQATSDCIFPVEDIKDFCFDNESSKLIQDFMVINKAAVFFSVSDHFQGFKLLNGREESKHVTETDTEVLRLKCTVNLLRERLQNFSERRNRHREDALMAHKTGDRALAFWHLKRLKTLERMRLSAMGLYDRVESTLDLILDSLLTLEVVKSMRLSTEVIQQNHVTADDVLNCMKELEDVSKEHQFFTTLIGEPLGSKDIEGVDWEEELRKLNDSTPVVEVSPVESLKIKTLVCEKLESAV